MGAAGSKRMPPIASNFMKGEQPTARHWPELWPWLVTMALAALLVVQILLADRTRLAADAGWRPVIAELCARLRCTVPAWRQPGAFHITSRDVHPHPSAAGVLLISATFRNDAPFPQAWPQLQLTLSNLDGDALGLRRFAPREYLGGDPATAQLDPGQSAAITLAVLDPGKRAVAFGMELR